MKEEYSPDGQQGQFIATTVLLEALLQTLSAQQVKEVRHRHQTIGMEVLDGHLAHPCSEAYLDALRNTLQAHQEMLANTIQGAIRREALQQTL